MYTHLSSHVYIIRYTNNTYVLLQMLRVSLQHCCWASYQIAEQVSIVNLVALRESWGIVLDNDLESDRRSGPGEVTHFMNTTYARPFWPPFFRSVESLYSFDTNTWPKARKTSHFDPFLSKLGKMYCFDPMGWGGGGWGWGWKWGWGWGWWSIWRANYMYVHVKSRIIAEGYPHGWPSQPIQHTFESQGCVQLGDVLLGCV